ncbi:MAG: response regulator transcription factor [Anaerolineales bacterium]|nr:response regulator transcription factor [Anaerolineales bacterium]
MSGDLILVVDDEPNIVQLARLYLEREGFRVKACGNGRAALEAIERDRPKLVVLDLMLPEVDGLEVCRRVRARDDPVAILMLTARDEEVDKIIGLEIGADDYLTKPFNPRELAARVKAILRRAERQSQLTGKPLRVGDVVLDPASREVTLAGAPLPLRTQEFELLATLAAHKGIVLSREQLLHLAWGYEYPGETRTVDVHVGALRKKLAGSGVTIETVTGVGYKLVG